jgi:RNA polymerase sigma-70 factor (ECF subfamily)
LQEETSQDEALLSRAASGDEDAFASLYDRLAGPAYSLALHILRDSGWAEDVLQEAFVNIWRRAGSYQRERGTVRAWALTIVRNRAVDHYRHRGAQPREVATTDLALLATSDESVWQTVVKSLEAETVRCALDAIPEEQRAPIEMAYFQGLTQAEIAERTMLPLGTVKSRMRLGLEKLRKHLEQAMQRTV